MSRPAAAIPTQADHWHYPVNQVNPSTRYFEFIPDVPTSTIDVADFFREQAEVWRRETGHLSLISQRINHPAYKRITRMGDSALPFILEEMERSRGHWFHALMTLADTNPIPADFDGTVDEAADLWIDWGRSHNLI